MRSRRSRDAASGGPDAATRRADAGAGATCSTPATRRREQRSLVLLRLGQLGLRHHHRDRPARAVPHLGGQAGGLPGPATRTRPAATDLHVLGSRSRPGSLVFYVVTVDHAPLGAAAAGGRRARRPDRHRKRTDVRGFAWVGAAAASAMVLVTGATGSSACVLLLVANLVPRRLAWSSTTRSCVDIADPRRARPGLHARLGARLPRRRPAARAQPGPRHGPRLASGSSKARRSGSACSPPALWWAAFTLIPYLGLRDRPPGRPRVGARPAGRGRLRAARRRRCGDLRGFPHDPALPARLPVLQRRHPDRDRRPRASTATSSWASASAQLIADDPARPVRRVRRRAAVRPAGRARTAPSGSILGSLVLWMVVVAHRVLPAGAPVRARSSALAVAHRDRARRHPGAVPVALQPARSRAAARRSTSASTRPASAARAGRGPSCSAWCSS